MTTCTECGLTLQGMDNEAEKCSYCLLGIEDRTEGYTEKWATSEGSKHLERIFKKDSTSYHLLANSSSTKEEFLANSENWYADIWNGKKYKYSETEMNNFWRLIKYHKKKIQTFFQKG